MQGEGSGAFGGGGGEGGGGGGGFEFGVDPSLDPELAMALRVSLEEERARQAAAAAVAAKAGGEPGATGGDADGAGTTVGAADGAGSSSAAAAGADAAAVGAMDLDEDALLQQALAMSMEVRAAGGGGGGSGGTSLLLLLLAMWLLPDCSVAWPPVSRHCRLMWHPHLRPAAPFPHVLIHTLPPPLTHTCCRWMIQARQLQGQRQLRPASQRARLPLPWQMSTWTKTCSVPWHCPCRHVAVSPVHERCWP